MASNRTCIQIYVYHRRNNVVVALVNADATEEEKEDGLKAYINRNLIFRSEITADHLAKVVRFFIEPVDPRDVRISGSEWIVKLSEIRLVKSHSYAIFVRAIDRIQEKAMIKFTCDSEENFIELEFPKAKKAVSSPSILETVREVTPSIPEGDSRTVPSSSMDVETRV